MKKIYLTLVFILSISFCFGGTITTELPKIIEEPCSLTASGTVETPWGTQTMTLTVYGDFDASLANKMREAIKGLRDSFK